MTDHDPFLNIDDQIRSALRAASPDAPTTEVLRKVERRARRRKRRARELVGAAVIAVAALGTAVALALSTGPQPAANGLSHRSQHPPMTTSTTGANASSSAGRTSPQAASSMSPASPGATQPPCPAHASTPVEPDGRYCGPNPGPGNGSGPDGTCSGTEKNPPCGQGAVVGRYYAYTMPGTCDGLIWFDHKQWVSELPAPNATSDFYVWIQLGPNGSLGWVGPQGSVGFMPYTGQALKACRS